MIDKLHKIGLGVLIAGIVMLVAGIVLGFTVGTIVVPICLAGSIIVNSVGITLMRFRVD